MPYIPQECRYAYDTAIERLAELLNTTGNNDKIAGELNYIIFRLANLLCSETSGGKHNYARMATVSSAMSEAQAEFRRRMMAPYEDRKIELAGDIEPCP